MANIELKAYRKLLLNFVYYNFLFGYTLTETIWLNRSGASAHGELTNVAMMQLLFIYGIYNLSRTDIACSWKKGMHAIFLGNLSLKCFPRRNKARIYSFTPTTKSRRPRSAAFMQSFERMESSLARIASLICSQRTDLIYNCSILNFICCSAASDRVRNSSGKWTLPLLRQEDPPVVLAQG